MVSFFLINAKNRWIEPNIGRLGTQSQSGKAMGKYFFALILAVLSCQKHVETAEDISFDAMATGFATRFEVPEIQASDFLSRSSSYTLVDARTPEEQSVSRIPGAILVRPDTDPASIPHRPGEKLVVYCAGGYRSARLTARLLEAKVDAVNLHGGIIAYANAGGAMVDPAGKPTHRVHGYNSAFALFVKAPNIGVVDPPVSTNKAP